MNGWDIYCDNMHNQYPLKTKKKGGGGECDVGLLFLSVSGGCVRSYISPEWLMKGKQKEVIQILFVGETSTTQKIRDAEVVLV